MFKKTLLKILVLIVACLASLAQAATTWHPISMLVFGDGFSDNGLSYKQRQIPASPPFWHHRFSNGPVGVEYLAYKLGVIKQDPAINPDYDRSNFLDYAVINASPTDQYAFRPEYITSLNTEIDWYAKTTNKPPVSTSLAFIFMGGETLLSKKCMQDSKNCAQQIAQGIKLGIQRLYNMGIHHFFVCTPNDLDNAPFTSLLLDLTASQIRQAQEAGQKITAAYEDIATNLRNTLPGIEIEVFNTYQFTSINEVGFRKPVNVPCYINIANGIEVYDRQVNAVCSKPNTYYYFDIIHPTTAAWRFSSQAMYNQIDAHTTWSKPPALHWWQRFFIKKV